jgi:hypothetical protein
LQVTAEQRGAACDVAFAYFYCDRNRADRRDPVIILRSIVRQLCAPSDVSWVEACVEACYQHHKQTGFSKDKLVAEECHELLLTLVASQKITCICIDGLDECEQETRYILMDILDDLLKKSPHTVKLYIASRTDADLRERYQHERSLEITADDNRDDIEKYVMEKLENSEFCRTKLVPAVRQKVLSTFREKSQGMCVYSSQYVFISTKLTGHPRFQWAVLQMTELLQLRRNQDIYRHLSRLPIGLEAAYDQIYQQIEDQLGSKAETAFAALKILMVSWRPLSPEELVVGATQDPQHSFQIDPDVDVAYVLDACRNLIVVADQPQEGGGSRYLVPTGDGSIKMEMTKKSAGGLGPAVGSTNIEHASICRFSHLSVQEYLEKRWSIEHAETFMAGICLRTVLSLRLPNDDRVADIDGAHLTENFREEIAFEPLLTVIEIEAEIQPSKRVRDAGSLLFGDEEGPVMDVYVEGHRGDGVDGWVAYVAAGLAVHFRAKSFQQVQVYAQYQDLMSEFLGAAENSSSAYRAWAGICQNDVAYLDQDRLRVLLKPRANAGIGCVILGLDWMLKSWLEKGQLDPNSRNGESLPLLMLAVSLSDYKVSQVLLQHGADVHLVGPFSSWALDLAIMDDIRDLVPLLLKHGSNPNFTGSNGKSSSALERATKSGNIEVVKQLLLHGGDPWLPDHREPPLVLAAAGRHPQVVSLLLGTLPEEPSLGVQHSIRMAVEAAVKTRDASAVEVVRLLMPHMTGDQVQDASVRSLYDNELGFAKVPLKV